jgi:hypothetical protein
MIVSVGVRRGDRERRAGTGTPAGEIPQDDHAMALNDTNWVVKLTGPSRAECTGVVLLRVWVLMAGHCLEDLMDTVRYAGHLHDPNLDSTVAVTEKVRAPEGLDLALVRLEHPLDLIAPDGGTVPPTAPLLTRTAPRTGDQAVLFGYGDNCDTGDCHLVHVTAPRAAGLRISDQIPESRIGPFVLLQAQDVTVDVGGVPVTYPGGKSLPGDSGGPMVVDHHLVGVDYSHDGEFTDVVDITAPASLNWILEVLGF